MLVYANLMVKKFELYFFFKKLKNVTSQKLLLFAKNLTQGKGLIKSVVNFRSENLLVFEVGASVKVIRYKFGPILVEEHDLIVLNNYDANIEAVKKPERLILILLGQMVFLNCLCELLFFGNDDVCKSHDEMENKEETQAKWKD